MQPTARMAGCEDVGGVEDEGWHGYGRRPDIWPWAT